MLDHFIRIVNSGMGPKSRFRLCHILASCIPAVAFAPLGYAPVPCFDESEHLVLLTFSHDCFSKEQSSFLLELALSFLPSLPEKPP